MNPIPHGSIKYINCLRCNQTSINKSVPIRRKHSFASEVKVLKLLEKNFINEPKIDHYPFPRLFEVDCDKQIMSISNCGIDLKHNYKNDIISPKTIDSYLYKTIECIGNNLNYNRIILSDFTPRIDDNNNKIYPTKNVCIDENGYIYLIDLADPKFGDNFYKIPTKKELKEVIRLYTSLTSQAKRRGREEDFTNTYRNFQKSPFVLWSILCMFLNIKDL